MPRIEAPTVAEHHAMRRAALVAAARELFADGGASAVTPAAVASRAGLARTSVYQYFPSTDALVAAAIETTFATANEVLAEAVSDADDARSRIRAYVRAALLVAARDHGSFRGLQLADLPAECAEQVGRLHATMLAPLHEAVAELGVPDPHVATALVFGAVSAAAEVLERGGDVETTAAHTLAFVDAGLSAAAAGARRS
jgi:AcrR family transcriptional regulator